MSIVQLVWKTLLHYFSRNLLVALGVAVSTAVLTGALIIGDSVRFSLEQTAFFRLGRISHAVTVTDRYFRSDLAGELSLETGYPVAPLLMLEGMAVSGGGQNRLNKVQILGVDQKFAGTAGLARSFELTGNDVVISGNMAKRLDVQPGDAIMVRIGKASLIPKNAPFVSDAETTVALHATVKAIAGREDMGYFNLKNSQSAPYNLFISLESLNRLMEFENRANRLLISAGDSGAEILNTALDKLILPADGGVALRETNLAGEFEITSERVFLEEVLVDAFRQAEGAKLVLTYFVNSLEHNDKITPYSFVSSVTGLPISGNEVILNRWTADDLQAVPGDTLTMSYYEIGPLRQLLEKSVPLVVKSVVPIEGEWADGSLMPHLPGLSDAGHCREWEAGVPVDLDKIRQKDEDYWNVHRGIPKAFVSADLARELWSNRFGSATALRFPARNFSEDQFLQRFRSGTAPSDLGFAILPVRSDGIEAARGGVDFSQLFLGLSFFLLGAAIILSALLFRLNLENRGSQTGTLMQLGFRRKQIARIVLYEAFWVALAGIPAGLLLAVLYTRVVFSFLNTLWWDIVRTDVLFIHIEAATLVTGALISLTVVFLAIAIPVRRFLRRRIAELHRPGPDIAKLHETGLLHILSYVLPLLAAILLLWQLASGEAHDPGIFFLAGGLLLSGFLLWVNKWLDAKHDPAANGFSLNGIAVRNLKRSKGRSMTVVIMFALGTFLVVSTGANRQDLFSGASEKSSGSGGFTYFAETSVPSLRP